MFSGSQLTTVDHRVPVFGYRYLGSKQFKHRVKATAWQEEAQTQDSVGVTSCAHLASGQVHSLP